MKRREERQRSVSPVWNLSPDVKEYHNEQDESSRQQSSNVDVMEMLASMEQNMKERDSQLKA